MWVSVCVCVSLCVCEGACVCVCLNVGTSLCVCKSVCAIVCVRGCQGPVCMFLVKLQWGAFISPEQRSIFLPLLQQLYSLQPSTHKPERGSRAQPQHACPPLNFFIYMVWIKIKKFPNAINKDKSIRYVYMAAGDFYGSNKALETTGIGVWMWLVEE